MRLLHPRARHEALGPLAGASSPSCAAAPTTTPSPFSPRTRPASTTAPSRWAASTRSAWARRGWSSGAGSPAGASGATSSARTSSTTSATRGAASPSTTTTSTTSRRRAPGSRGTSRRGLALRVGPAVPGRLRREQGSLDLDGLACCTPWPSPPPPRSSSAPSTGSAACRAPRTGKSELETARLPNLHALAGALGVRPPPPRGARHHAGQRAGPPRPLRLRPAPLPGGPRRPRGARHRLRAQAGRRRRARQLLHRGRARGASPTGAPGASAPISASALRAAARDPLDGVEIAHRAGQGAPLRPRPARRGPLRPAIRDRSAGARRAASAASRALAPEAERDGRARQRVRRGARGRSCATRRPPTWSSCAASTSSRDLPALPRARSACGPPPSPPTRCTAASRASSAWTCSRRAATFAEEIATLERHWEQLRLLLPPLQGHRQGGRGRRLRRQGRGARALRRAAAATCSRSRPTCSPSRATTRPRPS